ncbi:hypothetical protein CI109_104021 [Kwoniella shandongensis]|uniref:Uncharacterized protein n=1 Tax=Kwoniella shandongensis TaxID=1734106 RepID=A0A5M6C1T0_9TREE|nr:uncharacterized protein CI109_004094 [Kwoniella shandongensis]KAA5527555.1 hypothetical protein CI109_004094 [Kwoniella shandongensis]
MPAGDQSVAPRWAPFRHIIAIGFPPIAVWLVMGNHKYIVLLNLFLCCFGWFPGVAHALWVVSNPAFAINVQHGLGRPLPERQPESPELNLQTTITTATDTSKYPRSPHATTSSAQPPAASPAPTEGTLPPPGSPYSVSESLPPRYSGDQRIQPTSNPQSSTVTAGNSPSISQDSYESAIILQARRIEDGGGIALQPVTSSHTFGSLVATRPQEEVPPVPPLPSQARIETFSSPGAASSATFGSPQTPMEPGVATAVPVPSFALHLEPWEAETEAKDKEWPPLPSHSESGGPSSPLQEKKKQREPAV